MTKDKNDDDHENGEDDSSLDDSTYGGEEGSSSGEQVSNSSASSSLSSNAVENQYFGQSENRKVKSLKVVVFLVLFLSQRRNLRTLDAGTFSHQICCSFSPRSASRLCW